MQTVHDLREHADAKLFESDYQRALHGYAVLVQLQPNDLDARLRLADTLLAMGEVQAAGLIYMKLAQHAANAGYPLRALVCLLILRELEPELGKHVSELAQLYGKGSERIGRAVRMSLASTGIQLPEGLKLDSPPPPEELLPTAAQIAADLSKIAAYPERVPPMPLFSELPPQTFAKVLGAVKLLRKRPGDVILKQGEPGTAFYVLARGRVRVERENEEQAPVVLANLHGGAIFGEMALVSAEPRSATVVAEDDCDLLEFDKAALAAAASEVGTVAAALDKFTRERLLTNLLATAPLFKPLDRTQRRDLARRFQAVDVAPGTPVIREGDPGKGLYVVLSGSVEVWKTDDEADKVLLANLGPGEVFGEIALLHEEAATANVTATKQSTLLFLARELFQRLVAAIEEIREYVENLGDERLMDTRLSMETTESEPLTDDDLLFI